MADLKQIETEIVNILSQLTALNKVYDHEPVRLDQLPAATLFFDGFGQDDQATRKKSVNWRWILRIYVSLKPNVEQAQTDLKNLILSCTAKLRQNPTLNGSCLYHNVRSGEVFVLGDQNNPKLIAELILEATTDEPY